MSETRPPKPSPLRGHLSSTGVSLLYRRKPAWRDILERIAPPRPLGLISGAGDRDVARWVVSLALMRNGRAGAKGRAADLLPDHEPLRADRLREGEPAALACAIWVVGNALGHWTPARLAQAFGVSREDVGDALAAVMTTFAGIPAKEFTAGVADLQAVVRDQLEEWEAEQ